MQFFGHIAEERADKNHIVHAVRAGDYINKKVVYKSEDFTKQVIRNKSAAEKHRKNSGKVKEFFESEFFAAHTVRDERGEKHRNRGAERATRYGYADRPPYGLTAHDNFVVFERENSREEVHSAFNIIRAFGERSDYDVPHRVERQNGEQTEYDHYDVIARVIAV